jgi:hypothetical protein
MLAMWISGIGFVLGMGCIGASRLRQSGLVHLPHDLDLVLSKWRPAEGLDPRGSAMVLYSDSEYVEPVRELRPIGPCARLLFWSCENGYL